MMIITILFLFNAIRIKTDTGSADYSRGQNHMLIGFSLNTLQTTHVIVRSVSATFTQFALF